MWAATKGTLNTLLLAGRRKIIGCVRQNMLPSSLTAAAEKTREKNEEETWEEEAFSP